MLQPCNEKLEKLKISNYGGTTFPTWLGDTNFSNLVYLSFEDCRTCTSLPSVGQLPSIKELYMRGMSGIKRVGQEFYGNGCSRPFPKLEILYLSDMKEWEEWEEWISHGFDLVAQGFPLLQGLSISLCPKLQGRLPKHLPSLKKLHIHSCKQLQVSVLSLPADCDIEINSCKQVEHRNTIGLSSLNPLVFSDIASHVFFTEQFWQRLSQVEDVRIFGYKEATSFVKDDFECLAKLPQALHNFSFLRSICIANCPGLVSFPEAGLPSRLKSIVIQSCYAPDSWMENTSLECLSIYWCGSLTYLARSKLPPNLKRLLIGSCENLQTLTQEENNNLRSSISGIAVCPSLTSSLIKSELPAALEYIAIQYCSNFTSLSSSGNLPKALKQLHLCNLKIQSVAKSFQNTCLEEIEIRCCSSLVSFPVGEFSSMNLVTIRIHECEKLEAFTDNMHQLNHLQVTGSDCSRLVSFPERRVSSASLTQLTIKISNCSSLVSFPDRRLPFTNLTELIIENCVKLEVLPNHMQQLNHLRKIKISKCSSLVSFPDGGFPSTSLTELIIKNCEKLEALPNHMHNLTSLRNLKIQNCPAIKSFPPEDGFPTNLTLLNIRKLKIFKPLSEWELHRLTSLEFLQIEGCQDAVSFPMEEMLPASLMVLEITDFPNLKRLSSAIQNLSSLKGLQLSKCPKLKSFPKKGLPLTLLVLLIDQCPLLEQKCKKSSGKYWPVISHIPHAKIKNGEEDD